MSQTKNNLPKLHNNSYLSIRTYSSLLVILFVMSMLLNAKAVKIQNDYNIDNKTKEGNDGNSKGQDKLVRKLQQDQQSLFSQFQWQIQDQFDSQNNNQKLDNNKKTVYTKQKQKQKQSSKVSLVTYNSRQNNSKDITQDQSQKQQNIRNQNINNNNIREDNQQRKDNQNSKTSGKSAQSRYRQNQGVKSADLVNNIQQFSTIQENSQENNEGLYEFEEVVDGIGYVQEQAQGQVYAQEQGQVQDYQYNENEQNNQNYVDNAEGQNYGQQQYIYNNDYDYNQGEEEGTVAGQGEGQVLTQPQQERIYFQFENQQQNGYEDYNYNQNYNNNLEVNYQTQENSQNDGQYGVEQQEDGQYTQINQFVYDFPQDEVYYDEQNQQWGNQDQGDYLDEEPKKDKIEDQGEQVVAQNKGKQNKLQSQELKKEDKIVTNKTSQNKQSKDFIAYDEFVDTYKNNNIKFKDPQIMFIKAKNLQAQTERVISHNNNKSNSYTIGINQHADMKNQQFIAREVMGSGPPIDPFIRVKFQDEIKDEIMSSRQFDIDWSCLDTSFSKAGNCQATYAFAITSTIQITMRIHELPVSDLSPQELISCFKTDSSYNGCQNQNIGAVYQYVKGNGVGPQSQYPYQNERLSTSFNCNSKIIKNRDYIREKVFVESYGRVEKGNCAEVVYRLRFRALTVLVDSDYLKSYKDGFIHTENEVTPDHAVTLVGYDPDTEQFKFKNSWGSNWGINGYGYCTKSIGVCDYATYPIFSKEKALPKMVCSRR